MWRLAQDNQMILFIANRSMKGDDSLEQVMREENTLGSLPVLTVGNADRLLNDGEYRKRCVEALVAIVLDLENNLGTVRLYIL